MARFAVGRCDEGQSDDAPVGVDERRAARDRVLANGGVDEAGLGLDNVIKVNAYLADPVGDFAGWNEVYLEKFAAPYPCRTTVGAQLHVGVIELDVIAAGESRR